MTSDKKEVFDDEKVIKEEVLRDEIVIKEDMFDHEN